MRWVWLLALVGCECGKKPATKPVEGSAVITADAAKPDLASRFDELRGQRALRCLLLRERDTLNELAERADPVLVRAAAFSLVDEAKPDGDSPEQRALMQAIRVLGPLGDVDGLRLAFTRLDQIQGLEPAFADDDDAYRARISRDMPTKYRKPAMAWTWMPWVTQTAMAGELAAAAKLYDEIPLAERRPTSEHAAALVALGRIPKVRELMAAASERDRPVMLTEWVMTAAQMKQPLGDVVSELVAAIERGDDGYHGPRMRAVWRSPDKAAAARLRAALLARLTPEYAAKYPGVVEAMYVDFLDHGSPGERARIDAFATPELRDREKLLRTGALADALAYAIAQKHPGRFLARVWARAVVEGADAAFFDAFAAKVCAGPAPTVVTPTPAAKGLQLVVTERSRGLQHECDRRDLIVRLTNGEAVVDEEIYDGECTGACTAAEKREGQKQIREIERRIARGEGSVSELDYDFTGCYFVGHLAGRIDRAGERQVAIFAKQSMGPHSTVQTTHMLAFEVCGELYVSAGFGLRYSGGWRIEDLTVEESPDKREIRVRAQNEAWRGFIYRAALPECPGTPDERVQEADY